MLGRSGGVKDEVSGVWGWDGEPWCGVVLICDAEALVYCGIRGKEVANDGWCVTLS